MSSKIPGRAPVNIFTQLRNSLFLARCSILGVAVARFEGLWL